MKVYHSPKLLLDVGGSAVDWCCEMVAVQLLAELLAPWVAIVSCSQTYFFLLCGNGEKVVWYTNDRISV